MQSLSIEAMQEQINKMQEQLDEMKRTAKEEAKKQDVQYPPMLPDEGEWFISQEKFIVVEIYWDGVQSAKESGDQNVFPSEDIANAYADAFCVMLELRRCEGAGHYGEDGYESYTYDDCSEDVCRACNDSLSCFTLVPPFPTEELAQAAIDKVGLERIIAAYKLLANVKD